jgi:nitrogen fixation NifU-like protein
MTDELDKFVDLLQDQIYDETRMEFGEKAYKRWREPKFMERMASPDGYAKQTGTCGDTMEIFLKFENDRVTAAAFMTDGCGPSVVCGSYAAELSQGKSPEDLADFNGDVILEILGGLPEDHKHCAHLAAETVKRALDDYMGRAVKR